MTYTTYLIYFDQLFGLIDPIYDAILFLISLSLGVISIPFIFLASKNFTKKIFFC